MGAASSPLASASKRLLVIVVAGLLCLANNAEAQVASRRTYPNCNPTAILRKVAAELPADFYVQSAPGFDAESWDIRISNKGATWEATYLPTAALMAKGLWLGGGFPVVIIDKLACKIVNMEFYQ